MAARAYPDQGRGYDAAGCQVHRPDVLRHRVVSYEAEAEEKTSEDLIRQILNTVKVP
jgi:MoxR-like ATPase